MAKLRYFPARESDQIVWLTNYRAKLPVHGPACGILPAEVTATLADIDFVLYVLTGWHPALQSDLQEGTAYKRNLLSGSGPVVALPLATVLGSPPPAVEPGVLIRLQSQVQRIKVHSGYTVMIGEDMQIVGAENTSSHAAPQFTVSAEDASGWQQARIKFTKFGHQGVYIEMRRPQYNSEWAYLATGIESPYLDHAAMNAPSNPETREYRMRFWDKGEANGEWSAVSRVTVR